VVDAEKVLWFVPAAVGLVVGATVGRWWALSLAVPVGVYMWSQSGLEDDLPVLVGVGTAVFFGSGTAVGILVRKFERRFRQDDVHPRT
jgi:hypothetical protein